MNPAGCEALGWTDGCSFALSPPFSLYLSLGVEPLLLNNCGCFFKIAFFVGKQAQGIIDIVGGETLGDILVFDTLFFFPFKLTRSVYSVPYRAAVCYGQESDAAFTKVHI